MIDTFPVRSSTLTNCTGLERLYLPGNEFSLAAAGMGSLSDWLQTAVLNLNELRLEECRISDEGLQALAETVNHCKDLNLAGNDSITALGFRYLSTSLQSNSCRLEKLCLGAMNIGDDGAEVLARGLIGNKVLRCLQLRDDEDGIAITREGWSAFSAVLCDTSSVNNTYLSNHTFHQIDRGFDEEVDIVEDDDDRVVLNLQLNMQHPQYAARCKILMNHAHLNMTPLLQWELKFLPLAVAWFERAKPCTSLTICEANSASRRRVLEESSDDFQNRVLSAMYEFVRGMPMEVMKSREELIVIAYDDEIAMAEEEIKRRSEDVEQRDRKITQLEEENERLSKIALFLCVFAVFLSLEVTIEEQIVTQ